MRFPSTTWVWLLALSVALRSLVPWAHAQAQTSEHPLLAAFCGSSSLQLQQQARALAGELLDEPDTQVSTPCLGCVQAQAAALPPPVGLALQLTQTEGRVPTAKQSAAVIPATRPYAIRAPPSVPA